MKTLAIVALFVLAISARAQNPGPVYAVNTAPSGNCPSNTAQLVGPGGALYTCQNGTWGASSGVPSPFIIPGPITLSGPGTGYLDMLAGAPASIPTPASGSVTQFFDSTNSYHLSGKYSDGSVVDFTSVPAASPTISDATFTFAPGYPINPISGGVSAITMDATLTGATTPARNFIHALAVAGTITPASGAPGYFGDFISIGPTLNLSAGFGTYTFTGIVNDPSFSSVDDGSNLIGQLNDMIDYGPGTTAVLQGQQNDVDRESAGTVTLGVGSESTFFMSGATCTTCIGFLSDSFPSTSTFGTLVGFKQDYSNADAGTTITDLKGAWVTSPVGKFTATNNAGIQIDDQGSGSGHYAIRQNGASNVSQFDGLIGWTGQTLAAIGMLTIANGQETYCSDCTVTSGIDNTCAGSGSGAIAYKLNGVLRCAI